MSLEDVRKNQNISADQMAARLGLSPAELLAIESGKQTPRLCLAQKWANALGLSFEEFAHHYYAKADPAQLTCTITGACQAKEK
ncbi:helix-turn-helix domain-containing protein [Desulfotomaculum copahuensis]|uniref:HTH cro/C1-type domain-containing protein n=1 Tax=Desulfotomaculum copahuensis TaxID=1838280 RepID=A0A1B7LCY7_9FIRM|nr:helix-turn-helix transcriptional regulator [Desulfotomaculum copahuensis]OAT80734.1 hypothetical protein A6M21_12820 [Desulfotomaculum copahuensis]